MKAPLTFPSRLSEAPRKTKPRILFTRWLYATFRGVGSARGLDRLCEHRAAYLWICGGVSLNYHTATDSQVITGMAIG